MSALKIRVRARSGYSREAGGYDTWVEYQVWDGRTIVGRFELEEQAKAFIAKKEAESSS